MRDPRCSTSRRTLRLAAVILAVGVGLTAIYSCSLIVDQQSTQCQQDTDCTQFGNATCDKSIGICVSSTTSSSSSSTTSTTSSSSTSSGAPTCSVDGGIDGGGCYSSTCAATTNDQLLNACSTGCIPFDDSKVTPLLVGGKLPSLPKPPDGGM